jgi:cation transport ATPase
LSRRISFPQAGQTAAPHIAGGRSRWPLFERGWQSIVNRSLNMFTLIGMGVGVAYGYSLIAAIFPNLFPDSFRPADHRGSGHKGALD